MGESFNLSEIELTTPIYRIIDFDRLVEMVEENHNWLTRPSLWDDPFEGLLNHADFRSKTSIYNYPEITFSDYVYAQCWSFSEENDLLWRVYSPNKDGVRVKSTPIKLLQSLLCSDIVKRIKDDPEIDSSSGLSDDEERNDMQELVTEQIQLFIGKVEYLEVEEIKKYLESISSSSPYKDYIKSIFIKREPFQDEKEVRLGIHYFNWFSVHYPEFMENRFYYDTNINQFVDEIVFDPRISKQKYNALRDLLIKLGFENQILRSTIYDKEKY